MQTLNLTEASEFLKLSNETVRQKASRGIIPGRKIGKSWVFVKEHLADFISGRYPDQRRVFEVIDGGKQNNEETRCPSINVGKAKRGKSVLKQNQGSEYASLLGLKTSSKRKNCTTN